MRSEEEESSILGDLVAKGTLPESNLILLGKFCL